MNVLLFTVKDVKMVVCVVSVDILVGLTFYYRTILWTEEINPKHGQANRLRRAAPGCTLALCILLGAHLDIT